MFPPCFGGCRRGPDCSSRQQTCQLVAPAFAGLSTAFGPKAVTSRVKNVQHQPEREFGVAPLGCDGPIGGGAVKASPDMTLKRPYGQAIFLLSLSKKAVCCGDRKGYRRREVLCHTRRRPRRSHPATRPRPDLRDRLDNSSCMDRLKKLTEEEQRRRRLSGSCRLPVRILL